MQGGACGGSLSAPPFSLFRSQKPFRVADEVRNRKRRAIARDPETFSAYAIVFLRGVVPLAGGDACGRRGRRPSVSQSATSKRPCKNLLIEYNIGNKE